ncbi:MAG TPA: hypothetical protein VKK61_08405 [Tepidisphaeraceae bacterium]|nr:hypothetical protein [Tepidisphaeraceae bacterium]
MQASVVTYRNSDGVTVDLIAAVHIADRSFFQNLNKDFEKYDSLLYEMVKPEGFVPTTQPAAAGDVTRPLGWVSVLQHFMKDTLNLSFQLDEIDYTRPNFVHADLSIEKFMQMQQARGESMLTLMFQTMLRQMSQDDPNAANEPGIGDLLTAMQSPDRPRQLKLIIAKQFAQIDELTAGLDGPGGSVILTERNKTALNVLDQRIKAGDKKIGIFFGAAHLRGMEKILTEQMGFTQVGEPQWRTAWDMSKHE